MAVRGATIAARVSSRVRQYFSEIRTCARMAETPSAACGLIARTERFHLRNFLKRGTSAPGIAPERHRVLLSGERRDLWLRPGTGDIFVFHEIFTNRCYSIPQSILSSAQTIVDLGANIGLTTLFLSELFPAARFICVEPNPRNADVLRRNVAWLGDRVSVVQSAIADYCGQISFNDSEWTWGGHIAPDRPVSRTVPCSTVEEILKSHRLDSIDLLKVDIEGAEDLVFSSRPEWLVKVRCIVIELHGGYSLTRFREDVGARGLNVLPEGSAAGNVMHFAVAAGVAAGVVSGVAFSKAATV
jgi:FkbM family methyltransferase